MPSPPEVPRRLGPNHKDDCDGKDWRYSGYGYDRVKVCACGAEDHAPKAYDIGESNRRQSDFYRSVGGWDPEVNDV